MSHHCTWWETVSPAVRDADSNIVSPRYCAFQYSTISVKAYVNAWLPKITDIFNKLKFCTDSKILSADHCKQQCKKPSTNPKCSMQINPIITQSGHKNMVIVNQGEVRNIFYHFIQNWIQYCLHKFLRNHVWTDRQTDLTLCYLQQPRPYWCLETNRSCQRMGIHIINAIKLYFEQFDCYMST